MSAITSGRVRTRFSLQPSRAGPPKSSAVSLRRWIIVPIAPSRQGIFSLKISESRALLLFMGIPGFRLPRDPAVGDQDLEGLVALAVSMPHPDAFESGVADHLPQFRGLEPLVVMAQPGPHPGLAVAAQVQDEDASAGRQDPPGFRQRVGRML